jgi:hypothetical protein
MYDDFNGIIIDKKLIIKMLLIIVIISLSICFFCS